jgi:hypothetical protein
MFEMKNPVKRMRNLRTSCIVAIVTLALLVAPFCGPLCAASNNCPNAAAMTDSAENCHHTQISTNSPSDSPTASSAKLCSHRELPAIVSSQREFSPSRETSAIPVLHSSTEQPSPTGFRMGSKTDPSPQSASPATKTSILRF